MQTKSKPAFTVVEMIVVVPIVMILISVLAYSLVRLTSSSALANEKTKRLSELHNALSMIENDISLSARFLTKVELRDFDGNVGNFVFSKPQKANSVDHGIFPVYKYSDLPPDGYSLSPRLILDRFATVTSPYSVNNQRNPYDAGFSLKKDMKILARYSQGAYGTTDCQRNAPVLINTVYFTSGDKLYRRHILPAKNMGGLISNVAIVRYDDMFCAFTDSGVEYKLPWQKATCPKDLSYYYHYCQETDHLILRGAEMKIEYLDHDGNPMDQVYNKGLLGESKIQQILDGVKSIRVTLTSKVGIKNHKTTTVTGTIIANKMSDVPIQ